MKNKGKKKKDLDLDLTITDLKDSVLDSIEASYYHW